jgi:hypothetical protein
MCFFFRKHLELLNKLAEDAHCGLEGGELASGLQLGDGESRDISKSFRYML